MAYAVLSTKLACNRFLHIFSLLARVVCCADFFVVVVVHFFLGRCGQLNLLQECMLKELGFQNFSSTIVKVHLIVYINLHYHGGGINRIHRLLKAGKGL